MKGGVGVNVGEGIGVSLGVGVRVGVGVREGAELWRCALCDGTDWSRIPAMIPGPSRRDFIRLGGLSLASMAFRGFAPEFIDFDDSEVVRIGTSSWSVYSAPSLDSTITSTYYRDDLVHVYKQVTGLPPTPDASGKLQTNPNPIWYRVWGGYMWRARVQRVKTLYNVPVQSLPSASIPGGQGMLAEVTVPFTNPWRYSKAFGWEQLEWRLYYETVHWVDSIDDGPPGVLPEKGGNQFANEDNQIIVPLTAARTYLRDVRARNGLPGVSTVLMQGADPATNEVLKDDAVNVLRDRHNINYRNEDDFRVFTQADLLQSFSAISAAITVFLSAIAGISLLVGGIGVMNIMLVTVTERTREIGLRKAIGAKRRDILFQFLVESMTLSLTGGAIGIAIGVGGAAAVASLSNQFQPSVSPITVLLATGVSAFVGLMAGLYPALRAARMNPIEALRRE